MAAVQALKMETSTMASPPPLSSRPPRHLCGRFQFDECDDDFKLKFLGPEEANIHRIGQRSHAKLKVITEKDKHFLITLAGKEKRFMKSFLFSSQSNQKMFVFLGDDLKFRMAFFATYMLQELLAKWPKSKRPKVSLVLD